MSSTGIQNQLSKIDRYLEDYDGNFRKCFLLTDSKGRYLLPFLERRENFVVVWKSGARINDAYILEQVKVKVTRVNSPLILIWFGTCDFTQLGRDMDKLLRDITVDSAVTSLLEMKSKLIQYNSTAEVIFLQCPVYSIYHWNLYKGLQCEEHYDQVLHQLLSSFNSKIDELNGQYSPKFSLDLEKNTKTKHGKKSKYFFNFKDLYIDGIHPGPALSELWLKKMKKLVASLS
jgi:hypothetical protein